MEKVNSGFGCELTPGVIVSLKGQRTKSFIPIEGKEFNLSGLNDIEMQVLVEIPGMQGFFLDGKGRVIDPRDRARDREKKIYRFIRSVSFNQTEGYRIGDCGNAFYLLGLEHHGMMEEIKIEKIESQFNRFRISFGQNRPAPAVTKKPDLAANLSVA